MIALSQTGTNDCAIIWGSADEGPAGLRGMVDVASGSRASAGPPTLATVAAMAGVSPATVSRVINDSAPVTATIRRAVEDAVERLGYVPNRAARSLVTQRTDSIALVVREPVGFGLVDPYLSSMTVAASQSLVGTGVQLVLMMARNGEDHAQLAHYVRAGHVDGVMLLSVHDDDPLPAQLIRAGIPMVLGGRPMTPLAGCSYVEVDNHGGAGLVAHRLIEHGRTRPVTVAGPTDMTAGVDRLDGFRAALRELDQPPPPVAYGSFTRASGEAAMRALLTREPDLDAVFGASDMMAIGAISVLKESGRRVPDDVDVIGFDDVELGRHTDPALTTIHQPIAEQARLLVEMLVTRIRTGEAPPIPDLLPTSLVERRSG
jgi:DNA-binding LacI/PurR family transcriptional regulator